MSNEIESAQMAGVEAGRNFAIFQNKGYQGLYGGLGVKEIHERKGLKKNEKILDHMGSTELAANLFRARTFRARKRPIKPTTRLAGRSDRPSPSWAAPCRKTCRRRKRASGRLRVSRRSASTANEPE